MKYSPTTVEKPWGFFREFTHNQSSTVKSIVVKPGEALSLQKHANREEFWRVVSGKPTITVGDSVQTAAPGDEFFISKETPHRIAVDSNERLPAEIMEISFGTFDENDIIRLEDKYGRVTK
jgi:mannose-6-phosphate isomerase-like protein (cupin superfamily)